MEIPEAARCLAGLFGGGPGLAQFGSDLPHEARVAGEAGDVLDLVAFAPDHQRLAREAGIGAQDDPHLRPASTDLGDDALDLRDRAGAGIDARPAQPGGQQMVAAEHVERQVAIAAAAAVELTAQLSAGLPGRHAAGRR